MLKCILTLHCDFDLGSAAMENVGIKIALIQLLDYYYDSILVPN